MAAVEETKKGAKGAWAGVVVILVVAWLFLLLGVLGIYLHRTLYNQQVFTQRMTSVLEQPATQTALATEVTDVVIKQVPKAVIARPIIQSAAETVVAEPAFTSIIVAALGKLHQALLDPATANLVFKVEGLPQLLEQTIQPYDAEIAAKVGAAASTELANIPNLGPAFRLIQLGADLGPVSYIVVVLGLILLAVAALIAPVRRKGVIAGCLTLGITGITLAILLNLVNWGLGSATANDYVLNQAAQGIFDGLFSDLIHISHVIAIVGVIAAVLVWSLRWTAPLAASAADKALDSDAAATAGGRKLEVMDVWTVAKAWGSKAITPADSTWGKVLQLVGLLVVAFLILFKWNLIVDLFILIVAVLLLALAANRLMILILGRRAQHAESTAAASSGD
ncbi:MAG: hypothetical protein ACR2J9_03435 [Gaiellales bacterium]